MVAQILTFASRIFSPVWLSGPIFGKELRVVSRRKRHYLLRLAYLALLTVFVVVAWISAVDYGQSSATTIYKMADAGKWIIGTICWFQFITIPFIAVVLMSTSISDEVYHGTLSLLMTTPINSLQIVLGKLFSKMLHLLSLLAISLPLLAVVRVFGGVPWSYVIATWCITLTAAIFAGAVTMFFSALFRRAYAIILLTFAAAFVFYGVLPWMLSIILGLLMMATGLPHFMIALAYLSPFSAMGLVTMELAQPGMAGGGMMPFSFYWPIHCLVMLACSAGVLLPCVILVRRAALRQAFGSGSSPPGSLTAVPPPPPAAAVLIQPAPTATAPQTAQPPAPAPQFIPIPVPLGRIRRITGSPLVWKKLRTPMLPRRVLRIIGLAVSLVLLGMTYLLVILSKGIFEPETHAVYAVIFVLIGIVTTAVLAATSISSEKESRTLPILLTTPLSDWHIIAASVLEVFRRSLPVWLFLFAHMLVFTIVGIIHPIVLLHSLMLVIWVVFFLTGMGLYLSSSFKRTTPAVVINLCLVVAVWAILPWILGPVARLETPLIMLLDANPVVQAWNITEPAVGYGSLLRPDLEYWWFSVGSGSFLFGGRVSPGFTTLIMLVFMLVYSAVGLLFLWLAKRRLRQDIF